MHVIYGRNAHSILPIALNDITTNGLPYASRNGPVLRFPTATTISYSHPTERVVFHPERDANPFFHLMESLWMLAGRNDVDFVTRFVKTMANFSDDGKTFHGAYGFRWRVMFGFDQLSDIVTVLSNNRDDRRAVLQMWSAENDLNRQGKDFPCNLMAVFSVINRGKGDVLDMTVYNRSNDLVWGALGANAVHFSMLQEYVACRIGVAVGEYNQVSANMHVYTELYGDLFQRLVDKTASMTLAPDPYATGKVQPFPLMSIDPEEWERELFEFMKHPTSEFDDPFFEHVCKPMWRAHWALKAQNYDDFRFEDALGHLEFVMADDWRKAAFEWVQRREEKAKS